MGDTIKDDGSHESWVDVVERAEAAECALAVRDAQIARLRAELAGARAERDAARLERDARPEISREDAAGWCNASYPYWRLSEAERRTSWERVNDALRAHAARATSEARLRELKRQLSEAGDRHDRDDCDRIEAEIERIEKGEASGGACAACEGSGWVTWADRCEDCNGTGRKGER